MLSEKLRSNYNIIKYIFVFLAVFLFGIFVLSDSVWAQNGLLNNYNKSINGTLTHEEWNNLVHDFLQRKGATTIEGDLHIKELSGGEAGGLTVDGFVTFNSGLNAGYITGGEFGSLISGGNFIFPEKLTIKGDGDFKKNIYLENTTSPNNYGVIYKGGVPFIHDYRVSNSDGYNTFVGINSGNFTMSGTSGASGSYNSAFGYGTLSKLTRGQRNTAMGYEALTNVATGERNTAIGAHALSSITGGHYNSAVGTEALYNLSSGSRNTAMGYAALYNNTTSSYNVALGYHAANSTNSGSGNIAIGANALYSNTSGEFNIAIGFDAGRHIASGSNKSTGDNSIFIGQNTRANADGENNQIVIGANAIGAGSNSVVLGADTITKTLLKGNVGININPDNGYRLHVKGLIRTDRDNANDPLTTGYCIGTDCINSWDEVVGGDEEDNYWTKMASNANNIYNKNTGNVGIGTNDPKQKLDISGNLRLLNTNNANQAGIIYKDNNPFIHNYQGSGSNGHNLFIGLDSGNLLASNTGSYNTAIGSFALNSVDTGSSNIAIGYNALYHNTVGSHNIAIGYDAGKYTDDVQGYNFNGKNSIYIGSYTKPDDYDSNNQIVIGYNAVGEGDNSVVLGNNSITKTFLKGNVAIGTTSLAHNVRLTVDNAAGIAINTGSGIIKMNKAAIADEDVVNKGYLDSTLDTVIDDVYEDIYWDESSNNANNIYNKNTGNVGIGISNPQQKLDISGNLQLPRTTNSSQGVIYKEGVPFMHDYSVGATDYNVFIGSNSGNFTLSGTAKYNIALGREALYRLTSGSDNVAMGHQTLTQNTVGSYNIAIGRGALNQNNAGYYNSGLGSYTLAQNIDGMGNSALGYQALYYNTSGGYNTAFGFTALHSNTTGTMNVAMGYGAGRFVANGSNRETGNNSIFIGSDTRANANAENNQIVIGAHAIGAGSNSVVLGADTITKTLLKGNVGISTTTLAFETRLTIDDGTGKAINTGSGIIKMNKAPFDDEDVVNLGYLNSTLSTAIGGVYWDESPNNSNNIYSINSGNVGIGTNNPQQKLHVEGNLQLPGTDPNNFGIIYKDNKPFIHNFNRGTVGSITTIGRNTFVGLNAGNLTMGSSVTDYRHASDNTALGEGALNKLTTGYGNSALGSYALHFNTTGYRNSALGSYALHSNTTGTSNSAIGYQALESNTTGYSNSALGASALRDNTTGFNNSAVGVNALLNNINGNYNSTLGFQALLSNTDGNYNSALGSQALLYNTSGSYNTAIGYNAGNRIADGSTRQTGNNSIFIGANTKANANAQSNQIVIGANAVGIGADSVVLGDDSITKTLLKGNVGIGASPVTSTRLTVENGAGIAINTGSGIIKMNKAAIVGDDVVNLNSLLSYLSDDTYWSEYPVNSGNIINTNGGDVAINGILTVDSVVANKIGQSSSFNNLTANKITVQTIDPLYQINNIKYSTFAPSIVGGVKEEISGKLKINSKVGEEYQAIIDFAQEKVGSDLWVWYNVIDFSKDNVEVIATPYGSFANLYYQIKGTKLIFKSDKPVEISYRLTANRFDWQSWPTKALDQTEKPSFIINKK